jgi:tetratricopeptide (TPR) repeat protein
MHRAIGRKPGIEMQEMIWQMANCYRDIGFYDRAKHFYDEYYKITGNTINYLHNMIVLESWYGHNAEAIEYAKEMRMIDSTGRFQRQINITFQDYYLRLGEYEKAFEFYNKSPPRWFTNRSGYVLWKVGKKEEAMVHFNSFIERALESIETHDWGSEHKSTHYDLAGTYAFLGEKEKAYKYLAELKKRPGYPIWWVNLIKDDPMFESIRSEPRFQEIVRHVEEKFQNEHNRVLDWLEEEDLLLIE